MVLSSVVLLARENTSVPGMQLPSTVAVIAIGKDLIIVVGFCLIYMITSSIYIEAKRLGKWCTATQLVMVIAILFSPSLPGPLKWGPVVLWWAASLLAIATVIQYFKMGLYFVSRHEPQKPA